MPDEEFDRLRNQLTNDLINDGLIRSPTVEAAFRTVPRHLFLPGVPEKEAYIDQAIPTKFQDGKPVSSSSQPSIMAAMLEQLALERGMRVMEIGAGTGYNAALMAHIVGEAGEVITIDLDADLVESARAHLYAARYERVRVICQDGGYGYPQSAPYDRIILTVGAGDITPAWWEQLKPDGRLLLPLAIVGHSQKSTAFEFDGEYLQSLSIRDCGFMDLRGAFANRSIQNMPVGELANVFMEASKKNPPDSGEVYPWLTTKGLQDRDSGVDINIDELFGSLLLWIGLQEPGLITLSAIGDAVDQNLVPPLVGFDGAIKTMSTLVLLGENGMAALMRPPQEPGISRFPNDWKTPQTTTIYIRQFGPDPAPALRFLDILKAWQDAGRPSSDGLRIRAYPQMAELQPQPGEYIVEKTWTKLILDWPKRA